MAAILNKVYANLQLFLFGAQLSDFTLKFSLHVIVLLGHFLQYLVKLSDGLSWSKIILNR